LVYVNQREGLSKKLVATGRGVHNGREGGVPKEVQEAQKISG